MRVHGANWVVLAVALAACHREPQAQVEQRKALLRPEVRPVQQQAELERTRITDPSGELLPSGTKAAGLELPRGLQLYRQLERDYHFEAQHIDLDQLERYFAKRVVPYALTRTPTSVSLEDAQLKDAPNAPRVTIRIARLMSAEPVCNVFLQQASPPRVYPSEAEAQAVLEARRKHAE